MRIREVGALSKDAETVLIDVLGSLGPICRVDAKTFQIAVHNALQLRGCIVRSEVPVKNYPYGVYGQRYGRNGRVDLVVDAPFQAAIELDNLSPRAKSIQKLKTFDCPGFVALRNIPDVLVRV